MLLQLETIFSILPTLTLVNVYQGELKNSRLHPGITGDMTDRIAYLREQKEIQRKKVTAVILFPHPSLDIPLPRHIPPSTYPFLYTLVFSRHSGFRILIHHVYFKI